MELPTHLTTLSASNQCSIDYGPRENKIQFVTSNNINCIMQKSLMMGEFCGLEAIMRW